MNTQAQNNEQLQYFLNNAFDLLEDVKDKMGMFQTQRYHRLKKELEGVANQKAASQKLVIVHGD
jgi:hypothetical protein